MRAAVDAAGGDLDAILADPDRLEGVLSHMDLGQHITIKAVRHAVRVVCQGMPGFKSVRHVHDQHI